MTPLDHGKPSRLACILRASSARVALALALTTALTTACSRGSDAGRDKPGSSPSAAPPSQKAPGSETAVLDWIRGFDECSLGHRGVLLDLGDSTMRARYGSRLSHAPVETFERDGATWLRMHSRSLPLSFMATEPTPKDAGLVVSARVHGGAARSISVSLDGKSLGQLALTRNETKIVELRSPTTILEPGAHELSLRFHGGARPGTDTLGDIDWVRIGPHDGDAPYAAPTRRGALVSTAIGGQQKRAISLRSTSWARCSGFLPSGSELETDLALTGGGEADVEVRVLRDRQEPRVITALHLGPADGSAWKPLRLALGDADTMASVELSVVRAHKGTRVLFGEPRVRHAEPPIKSVPAPPARGVVLVILGTVAPRSLTTFGGFRPTPELGRLAAQSLIFDAHRASSPFANAVVASMLTGTGPREHGIIDADARLARGSTTVADAARQGGVSTGFFTANPTTSDAYGFDRAWETFRAHSPLEEGQATLVFDEAIQFLDAHKQGRFLVVIHARGGHPPWDASAEQLKDLPPQNYTGGLDPKHAGELLAKAKRVPPVIRYTDGDRERAAALHTLAVQAHDEALGRLLSALRANGQDAGTAILVTGDVAPDESAHVPFSETDTLDEATLSTFLLARPPEATRLVTGHVAVPTESMHVATTLLGALGLEPPVGFRAPSLFALAQAPSARGGRPRMAIGAGKFAARWGEFVLMGNKDRVPRLCNLSLEPACLTDVRSTHPLAAEILHRRLFDELVRDPKLQREEARIDPPMANALKAWGR